MSFECSDVITPLLSKQKTIIQFIAIMPNGNTFYTRQTLAPFYSSLTNSNGFDVLSSESTSCSNGKLQPFSIQHKLLSFNDAHGFTIDSDGKVQLSPLWKDPLDLQYRFKLDCEATGQNWASNQVNKKHD
eukprot:gene8422-9908_t